VTTVLGAYPALRVTFVHGHLSVDVTCTPQFQALLTCAIEINEPMYSTLDVSFYALFFALLVAKDQWSEWFRKQLAVDNVDVDAILSIKSLKQSDLERVRDSYGFVEIPAQVRTSATAFQWIQGAIDTLQNPNEAFDVSHLILGLIATPTKRHLTLREYGLDVPELRIAFDIEVSRLSRVSLPDVRSAEGAETGLTPTEALADSEPEEESPKAMQFSAHILSDIATARDRLNYKVYASAIRSFILSPRTTFPLSVSVQAQWGGGKSSLMRMIRSELDPLYRGADGRRSDEDSKASVLTVRDAAKVIDEFRRTGDFTPDPSPPIKGPASSTFHITVWFNAWKYESSDQVWAGLVDAIIREITSRMTTVDREKFYVRLNLRRIDPNKVREAIYERAFARWLRIGGALWSAALALVAGSVGAAAGALLHTSALEVGGAGGLLVGTIAFFGTFLRAVTETQSEHASVAFHDLVSAPDYRSTLGFVHDVEADFRKILDVVPRDYWPIVVFIDDLDRCAPETISRVMEGINLFLAGDFPDFVFILGMDAELVAAALDADHKAVLDCLSEGVKLPLGWRFMDKFVQLPFMIPPPSELAYQNYVLDMLVRGGASESAACESGADATGPALRERARTPEEELRLSFDSEQAESARRLQEAVSTYDESHRGVQASVEWALRFFARNPRDVKRFLNALRLHNFLANATTGPRLSLHQIMVWTVLCVKWPQVVRWTRRDAVADSYGQTRLEILESVASDSGTIAEWQQAALERLNLHVANTEWLEDSVLFEFLRDHALWYPDELLSAGAGRGLY
jgi:hypothetical protein